MDFINEWKAFGRKNIKILSVSLLAFFITKFCFRTNKLLESASTLISTQLKLVNILRNMRRTINIKVSLNLSGIKPKPARKRTTNEEREKNKQNVRNYVVRLGLLRPRREPNIKPVKLNVMNDSNNAMKRRKL